MAIFGEVNGGGVVSRRHSGGNFTHSYLLTTPTTFTVTTAIVSIPSFSHDVEEFGKKIKLEILSILFLD